MKMSRKLFIFGLLTVLFSALLTACHGAKETSSFALPDSFDESKTYNIVFWAKNENNATQRGVYEEAIAGFETAYPNIDVTIKHYTDYKDIYNDVITNIQTGTTPNVCITYPDHIATYITGDDVVVPLDGLVTHDKYGFGGSDVKFDSPSYGDLIGEFLDECYIGDTLYAVPFMRSTEACYINKNYVESLGYEIPDVLTWDFVFEVSNKALEKDSNGNFKLNGQKVLFPFIYKSTDNMMIQMLRQLDAGYSDENGNIEIFNDDTKDILFTISENAAPKAFTTFSIRGYPGNFLNKGQCIFAVDSTAGATWMGCEAPLIDVPEGSLADFETVVRPIPQFDPENPKMISQGPSLCVFNKEDSSEVVASWLFVQYLLTNDVQMAYSGTEGYVPVTSSAQNDPAYLDYISRGGEDNDLHYSIKIDATKMLIDNVENTFTAPVFNGSASLRSAAGEMIEKVTKSTTRGEKIDDKYIENLYSDMISLYRLNHTSGSGSGRNLGALPGMSVALLSALGAVWLGIGAYVLFIYLKKRKKVKK